MKPLLILNLFLICATHSHAQIDTSFTIVRKNVPAKFSFTKYGKGWVVKNSAIYAIDKPQIHRLNMLLRSFVASESGYDSLVKNYHHVDSIFASKELHYAEMVKTQELRSKNYEAAYQSLLTISSKLDEQLRNCKDLALKDHKNKKKKSTLVGIVALSVGVLIGVVVE